MDMGERSLRRSKGVSKASESQEKLTPAKGRTHQSCDPEFSAQLAGRHFPGENHFSVLSWSEFTLIPVVNSFYKAGRGSQNPQVSVFPDS